MINQCGDAYTSIDTASIAGQLDKGLQDTQVTFVMMWIPTVIKIIEISIAIIAITVKGYIEFGNKMDCSTFPEQFKEFLKYYLIFN